jgi:hypothetical protein
MRYGPTAISAAALFLMLCLVVSPGPAFALNATTTNVVCNSPVTVGLQSSCTITVTSSGSPTGTVDSFSSSGSGNFGSPSCTLSSGSCSVTYTPTSTVGSPHTIGATYEGDSSNSPSASRTNSGSVGVNEVQSSLAIGCSPSTVQVGTSVSCTATVTGYSPAGFVTFLNSGGTATVTVPAFCTLSANGPSTSSCNVTVTTAGAGSAGIQASYGGDFNNIGPAFLSTTTITVSPATSTTTANCAPATLVVGQSTTCTATVAGYSPTGTVFWQTSDSKGTFSSNPCALSSGSCSVSYTPTSSATVTATYSGDPNNLGSSGASTITVNVHEMVQITVANSGPPTSVTLSGCSVSPTTIPADGTPQSFQATSGCQPVTVTLPPAGTNARYLTATGQNSLPIGSCASSSCQTFSATIYYEVENTYQASPTSPAAWSTPGSIAVNGTALGTSGKTVCTITVSTGAGQFSCQGWTDYNTQAVMGILGVSQTQRWAASQSSFADTTGGNQHSSSYFSQVLEGFQYSLVGSTTAPSAPRLNYSSFGAGSTVPLIGSASSVWLDSGSGWSVPTALAGSTANERWESSVSSGAATAGQTVALVYYHQFLVGFASSVIGGGTAYSSPSVSFTAFGAPAKGSQSWVDSGARYNYTNPLAGSTAVERWFTSRPVGVVSGAGAVSAVYYHQYAFALNYTVSGGGAYSNPRLNYTALGSPGLEQLNATRTTFWFDAGTSWGVTPLLPSSSSTERWITSQTASGTASAPVEAQLRYHHQYLGTLRYSIKGTGGSPPVPRLNYTTYGAALASALSTSPGPFWMDSGSSWDVPILLAGGQGERWLSNVTGVNVASAPIQIDAQYAHQFFVEVGVSTAAGGAVANIDQWHDQGSSVVLDETSANLWSFAYWQGATPFSYNGTTLKPTVTVSGPANETAIFFPGLTISTQSQGSVAYSYGSISGTVLAGTQSTIYPPPGRNVTLTATPNTVEIMFVGWAGWLTGTQLQSSLAINSPAQVHASFATDYNDIRTFAIAAIGVFIVAAYVFVVRRGFGPKIRQ